MDIVEIVIGTVEVGGISLLIYAYKDWKGMKKLIRDQKEEIQDLKGKVDLKDLEIKMLNK